VKDSGERAERVCFTGILIKKRHIFADRNRLNLFKYGNPIKGSTSGNPGRGVHNLYN
jgi:hypothetical protein